MTVASIKGRLPLAALIIANLIPIIGVLFFDWVLMDVILAYWFETAIGIALATIKIFLVTSLNAKYNWAFFFTPLFPLFFGGVAFFYLGFLVMFFNGQGELDQNELASIMQASFGRTYWSLIAFGISRFTSFIVHFVAKKEYIGIKFSDIADDILKRFWILHVTILFGGIALMLLGSILPLLIIFTVILAVIDVQAHLKLHKAKKPQSSTPAIV